MRQKTALEELVDENTELLSKVKKLRACKDADEVLAVEKEFATDEEELDTLIERTKEQLEKFDRAVSYVAYREFGSGTTARFDYYKDPDTFDLANDGIENEYIIKDDIEYSLNRSHPRIKKLCKAIEKLAIYIESEAPSELFETLRN